MIGRAFARLIVIAPAGRDRRRNLLWLCRCCCGQEMTTAGYRLRNGETRSCGCLQREKVTECNRTHGQSGGRLYNIWANMKARCGNRSDPQYCDYGERGIAVCASWIGDFEAFAQWAFDNGYADHLTIDRIDNNKGYFPENCRWATMVQQSRNKRPRKDQKLSDVDVERIRADRRYQREIAKDFHISQGHVSRIKRGAQRIFPTDHPTVQFKED